MNDTLYAFLSLEFSGLIIAAMIFAVSILVIRGTRSKVVRWLGRAIAAIAVILAIGAVSHLVRVSEIDDRFPAPGQMVDVGGYEVHMLAEGPDDGPTIVWFAGGYTGGLGFYQHHAVLKNEVRSILFDRPGSGWSDVGPFPRTTGGQAEEVMAALEAAGEQGPFIFAGHSFGGLLAINIARRDPQETAAVVMMDATPLDVVFYGLDKKGLGSFSKLGYMMTFTRIFGLYRSVEPLDADGNDDTAFTQPMLVNQYIQNKAGFWTSAGSALSELSPTGINENAFDTMVYDGELGDLPLYLVAPMGADPTIPAYAEMVAGGPGSRADRFVAFLDSTRERYLSASNNSKRIIAPEGTGHNFVYEVPDFVIETMRDVVRDVNEADAEYRSLTTDWPGPYGGVPPVDIATPASMEAAFERAIAQNLRDVDRIANSRLPADFDNTIIALEASGLALARIEQLFGIFTNTANSPEIAEVQLRVMPKVARARDQITHNESLFSRVKSVYDRLPESAPDDEARRLVEVVYSRMVGGGAALDQDDKARLAEINAELTAQITRFGQNANKDEARLVEFADSEDVFDGLPAPQIAAAKMAATQRGEPDKWAIPISRPSVWPVLMHVHDRAFRERVWRTWVGRGGNDGELDNGPVMTEILRLRGEKAKLFGYPTFAHFQTANRMVGTPENALDILMRTWVSLEAPTQQSIAQMQAIADREGADFSLQAWDRLYYEEKLKQEQFSFQSSDVLPYFELDNIVDAMLWTADQVYDLQFSEAQGIPVVSDDIRVFEVYRDDELHGVIWMDLFAREGKGPASWAAQYRSAENFRGKIIPAVVLHSAAQKPVDGGPILVPYPRANVIFHEFGHALHTLSNSASYPSLGPLSLPWDFIEVPALLHERWLMTDEVLSQFAVHYETGEPMPMELRQRLRDSLQYDRVFSATQSFLGGAIVDMRLHLLADGSEIDAEAVEAAVVEEIGLPEAIDLILYAPHAFHTFSPQYAAGVYTYLWSDILAADIAEQFLESPGGFYDEATALRYRETILDIGSARPIDEAYGEFRGRDPDHNALMRRFNLINEAAEYD